MGICGRILIVLISDKLLNFILGAYNHLVEVKRRKINPIGHGRCLNDSSKRNAFSVNGLSMKGFPLGLPVAAVLWRNPKVSAVLALERALLCYCGGKTGWMSVRAAQVSSCRLPKREGAGSVFSIFMLAVRRLVLCYPRVHALSLSNMLDICSTMLVISTNDYFHCQLVNYFRIL